MAKPPKKTALTTATEETEAVRLLRELLTPMREPYTLDASIDRVRKLSHLYALAWHDDELAGAIHGLISQSFWAYLALAAWTVNPKSELRVMPFSPLVCYATIADFLDEKNDAGTWEHNLVAVEKSRQLMLSWICMLRLDWFCLLTPYSECIMISKTKEDTQEMLLRVTESHAVMPEVMRGILDLHGTRYKAGSVRYANGSKILALPQRGGQATRSTVPTAWFFDEAAFQIDFEKNYQAVRGTSSDTRTQGLMASTPYPSFYEYLVKDTLDGRRGGTPHDYLAERGAALPGLRIRRNERNRADVISMHYSADPGRRSEEWKATAMKGVPMYQWRQEQELDWTARGGNPVFKMLSEQIHVMDAEPEVVAMGKHGYCIRIPGLVDAKGEPLFRPVTLLRGIDHGTTNFCAAIWVAVDEDLDWFVYRCYKQKGWFARENAQAIAERSEGERYAVNVIDAMQGLPDQRGKVEDLYRNFKDSRGEFPLRTIEAVKKGAGSRQEGLDAIALMLHATLAVVAPNDPYWREEGYTEAHRDSFCRESAVYIAPSCIEVFRELQQARFDERPGGDPLMAQPETTVDMMDDLLDSWRYVIRSGGRFIRKTLARQTEDVEARQV
jgi:hypothetical protein